MYSKARNASSKVIIEVQIEVKLTPLLSAEENSYSTKSGLQLK